MIKTDNTPVKLKHDFICKEESACFVGGYAKFKAKMENSSLLLLLLTFLIKISAAAVFKSLINLISLIPAGKEFYFYKLRFCGHNRKKIQPCTVGRFARRLLQRKACTVIIHQVPCSGKLQKRQNIAPAHAFFGSPTQGFFQRKEVFL